MLLFDDMELLLVRFSGSHKTRDRRVTHRRSIGRSFVYRRNWLRRGEVSAIIAVQHGVVVGGVVRLRREGRESQSLGQGRSSAYPC